MHVFVRDFTIPARVGVYAPERAAAQRVRFDVDVTLDLAKDDPVSENYYSYDDITGAIETVVGEGHVDLVETLAERIAAHILADDRVVRVHIRIEKPDIQPGIRGVEIVFERTARGA